MKSCPRRLLGERVASTLRVWTEHPPLTSIPESRAKKGAAVRETVYGPHQKSCNQSDPAKASPMNPTEKGTCQGTLAAYRNIGT